ncbi:hypothetical protein BDV12DRAFT_203712 [Aspergillus spectabilis]
MAKPPRFSKSIYKTHAQQTHYHPCSLRSFHLSTAMATFNALVVNPHTASKEDVLCYYAISENDYNGHLGARISSIFVILFVSKLLPSSLSWPRASHAGKSPTTSTSSPGTSAPASF